MESIRPLDSELKKDIGTELKKVEYNPLPKKPETQQPQPKSERKGSIKLLVALMVIFWPAAIYYAITRSFEHHHNK